jgi:hypothetical protein
MYGEADDIAAADVRRDRELDWDFTYRSYMAQRYSILLHCIASSMIEPGNVFCNHSQDTVYVSAAQGPLNSSAKGLENSAENGQNSDKHTSKMRAVYRKVFHGL